MVLINCCIPHDPVQVSTDRVEYGERALHRMVSVSDFTPFFFSGTV